MKRARPDDSGEQSGGSPTKERRTSMGAGAGGAASALSTPGSSHIEHVSALDTSIAALEKGASHTASPSGAAVAPAAPAGGANASTKRTDYLPWDDYFVAVALLSAQRSKDPSTQVGACVVDPDNRICGVGYNGFPAGIPDDSLPWARTGASELDTKYPYVCHAEVNCILNKNQASLKGCRMYVGLFPCNDCSKMIIQSGIREVIYLSDKYHDATPFVASRRLLDLAGVTYRQYVPTRDTVVLRLRE